jgi:hypothetical protein
MMQVLDLKPAVDPGGREMAHVATFDLALSDDVKIYGMRLLRTPQGNYVSYAPTALGGRRSATFARPLAEAITTAAIARYTEQATAHGSPSRI